MPQMKHTPTLLMVLTLVISPISWMNHYVTLILPFALVLQAWRDASTERRPALRHSIGIAAALVLTSVWGVLMAFSLPLVGALLLGALLVHLLRGRPSPGESPEVENVRSA